MITITFPWWYILLSLPFIVLAGFPAYGQLIQVCKNFGKPLLGFYGTEVSFFGIFDIALNVTWGSLYFLELPFSHRIGNNWWNRDWTLSQRTEYYCNTVADSRNERATKLGLQLNKIVPGHIRMPESTA